MSKNLPKEKVDMIGSSELTDSQLMRESKRDLVQRIRVAETMAEYRRDQLAEKDRDHEVVKAQFIDGARQEQNKLQRELDTVRAELRAVRDERDTFWALLRRLVGR